MECSEVKVKVTKNKTTPVKYRYLKNVLKYSNEVVLLRYWPPLLKSESLCTFKCVQILCYFGKCEWTWQKMCQAFVCLYAGICVNVNNLDFCERKYDFEKQNTFLQSSWNI